jgi:hypothetical protein
MVGLRRADAAGKTGRWSQAARHPKTKPRTGSNHGAGFSFSSSPDFPGCRGGVTYVKFFNM